MENEKIVFKPVDYDVVLADLKAQRDRLDQAIAAIEALQGGGRTGVQSKGNGAIPAKPDELRPDEFFGLTVLQAAVKYLGMVKRPTSSIDIAKGLVSGGYLFSTDKPNETVAAILNRNDAKGGEVVRISKGLYGLADWYQNRPKRKKVAGGAAEVEDVPEGDPTPST